MIRRYSAISGFDISELFLRLVFCFMTGNSDMHYKNFSLIEDRPGSRHFHLSEAYDLLPDDMKQEMIRLMEEREKALE